MHLHHQRLVNQRVTGTKLDDPCLTVRWMGALQAQDYGQAVWAVGLRTKSGTLADVERALSDKKIVRTWPMRGTLHFVPAEDAKWMVKLSSARSLASSRRRREDLGLNDAIIAQSQALFYDAIKVAGFLSRPKMMRLLEDAGIGTEGQRGYHLLWNAAQAGLIAIGPMEKKQQTFVLLDEWAPDAKDLPREVALALLACRYFTSHGPSTLNDFAWWAGLPLKDARSALMDVRHELDSKKVDEIEYWMAADTPESAEYDPGSIYLLPGFDEYLLGYSDRDAVLTKEHFQKVIPGANGVFKPVMVIGGHIAGTWMRAVKKNKVEITLDPFAPLDIPKDSVIQAAQGYADFLGLPVSEVIIKASD